MVAREPIPVGKLPPALLEALLSSFRIRRNSGVLMGPRFGEDAAVIDLGGKCLVATTDPITFTAERLGWYAVNVNANDVATLGARPRWFLATLLLPEGRTTATFARRIFQDILRACRALGVTLCGGHTEITAGLERPVLVGQMLGEARRNELVLKDRQRPGDIILLTKGIALEGTAILAREKAATLARKVAAGVVRRARRLLSAPGISVVREARLARQLTGVHAMHDPTEGGLLAGLYELARAGHVGLRVWEDRVPILPETQAFSRALGFDPMALIASGALLIVASPRAVPKLLRAFARHRIRAAAIGEICRESDGLEILGRTARDRRLLVPPRRDEIARLLE